MGSKIQGTTRQRFSLIAATAVVSGAVMQAQTGRFDLLGPKVDVHVTRGDRSLPIASVPNLQAGDKLQVHAELPETQSVHLLLVVAFLRGTTNPPPDRWFTRIETWDKRVRGEGVSVTVPDGAQQALMFIAPETGGDFSTLKSAVRGRPGTFVRASQDLNEASFEQSRIERYVQAIKQVPPGSPADLLDHSHKLAATLQLKPNDDCYKRPTDIHAACLSQSGAALLLDDGHGQTMAQLLSTGPTSDLIGAVAGTPVATAGGAAMYSAYVGTVLDVVRLLSGLHTAKYQYIPAIAFPDADTLNLRLNTAPSFNNPKSVIVIALPAIQKAVPPPLQLQDAQHVSCLLQPRMVLPLNGAPLVFSTGFAHDLTLHLNQPGPDGRTDLPLAPDAYEGGLVVTDAVVRKPLGMVAPEIQPGTAVGAAAPTAAGSVAAEHAVAKGAGPTAPGVPGSTPPAAASSLVKGNTSKQAVDAGGPVQGTGSVRGFWGFDSFDGPTVTLQRRLGEGWTVSSAGELFTGRSNTVMLHSTGTACVSGIELGHAGGALQQPVEWHVQEGSAAPAVTVKLPLETAAPGGLNLAVRQYAEPDGTDATQTVPLRAYADAVRVEEMVAHAGDRSIVVRGTGLGGVKSASLKGLTFVPAGEPAADEKSLRLEVVPITPAKLPAFKAGDTGIADLALSDGRTVQVPFHVDAARPAVTLLSTSIQPGSPQGLPVALDDAHAIPMDGKLSFALRSDMPAKFTRNEKVEVALADGSLTTTLSLADRTLVLQDVRTALGFVSPSTVFGPSAFGALQLRVLAENGTTSDWISLGTLVRTPVVRQVTCGLRASAGNSHSAGTLAAGTPAASAAMAATGDVVPVETGAPATQAAETPCTLEGSNLFLIQAVSGAAAFASASDVPAGFSSEMLQVPRPADGRTLYLRLRDDPGHVAMVTVEVMRVARSGPKP